MSTLLRWVLILGLILSLGGPVPVQGAATPAPARTEALAAGVEQAVQLAAGDSHVCALTAAGTVWCWGDNYFGQLGTGGARSNSYLPKPVRGLPPVREIRAGEFSTCAITTANDLYCWGRGELYALGNASTAVAPRPFKLLSNVRAVGMGWNHGCASLLDGSLKCWGRIAYYTPDGTARILGSQTPGDVIQPQASPMLELTSGNGYTCGRLETGAISCWGIAAYIDYGPSAPTMVPPTVIGAGMRAVSGQTTHVCAVTTGGGVQCLGTNTYGQTGQAPSGVIDGLFRAVPGAAAMTAVTTGARHTCTLDGQGKVWCWGDNSSAQLGRGRTSAPDATPGVAVALNEAATQVAATSLSTCAATATGKVFCWGSNSAKQTSARGIGAQPWPVRVPGFGPASQDPIAVTGIEVTQGIQNLSNDTPLVAARRTVLRVYARSTTGASSVPVVALTGARNGVTLPESPLTPANAVRVTMADGDRLAYSGGFYFELPPSWTQAGSLELTTVGYTSDLICEDQTGTPADCRATVTFETVPAAELMIIGLPYLNRSGNRVAAPSLADRRRVAQQVLRLFPVPDVVWSTQDAATSPETVGRAGQTWWDERRLYFIPLLQQRAADGCASPCATSYVYLAQEPPPPADVGWYGTALDGMAVSYTYHGRFSPTDESNFLFPHEVGHTFGLLHAPCDDTSVPAANLDPGFPDPTGRINASLHADHDFIGLDIAKRRLYASDTRDLLSYCTPAWISNYHFEKLLRNFQAGFDFPSLPVLPGVSAQAVGDALLVSGSITGNVATIEPVYALPQVNLPSGPASGDFAVRLLDSTGGVLSTVNLSLVSEPAAEPASAGLLFVGVIPQVAGFARLQILHQTAVIGERAVSPTAPTVTLQSPNGGETLTGPVTLTWTASDADGDLLRFMVQTSPDGGITWRTLAANLAETALQIDSAILPGSPGTRFRVIASDGLRSAFDMSDGPATIPAHAPTVEIVAPDADSPYLANSFMVVEASAYDPEDGSALPDTAYVWTTTDAQVLATGRVAVIDAAMLSPDEPRVRVTVTDASGLSASAERAFQLVPPLMLELLYLPSLRR